MRISRLLFFSVFFLSCLSLAASGSENTHSPMSYRGFSGGMMLHTGYLSSQRFNYSDLSGNVFSKKISGMPVGIGGAIRFQFGDHFRIGTEGYSSTLYYGAYDRFSIGWGGILADYMFKAGRFYPFAGLTFGGGGGKNLFVKDSDPYDFAFEQSVLFRNYSFLCIAPFAGVEFALTDALRVVLKADYMFNVTGRSPDFASGVRIYAGIMFYHLKK